MTHHDLVFSSHRGQLELALHIKKEREQAPDARIIVALDWYFLQLNYYKYRYGMEWLESGVHTLLYAGADEVILPYDLGKLNKAASGMKCMLKKARHVEVCLTFIKHEEHPLWVASGNEEIDDIMNDLRGNNERHSRDYLCAIQPFVRCTLLKTLPS